MFNIHDNKLINYKKKTIVMSFIPFTENNYENKNWNLFGSVFPEANPHQHEADPNH